MVRVRVTVTILGCEMIYVFEGPHKDRSERDWVCACAWVCVERVLSHLWHILRHDWFHAHGVPCVSSGEDVAFSCMEDPQLFWQQSCFEWCKDFVTVLSLLLSGALVALALKFRDLFLFMFPSTHTHTKLCDLKTDKLPPGSKAPLIPVCWGQSGS